MNPKITVRIANFALTKQSAFPLNKDKIAYPNLDSARTPVPHNESMPRPVSPKDGLDAIDSSADENDCDEFISLDSADSKYNSTENLILFSQKHLNQVWANCGPRAACGRRQTFVRTAKASSK